VTDLPSNVVEGEPFYTPLKLRVLDDLGNPVEGVICFVHVDKYDVFRLPLGYKQTILGGRVKDILYGISASYEPDNNDPFSTKDLDYTYTDSEGGIEFPFL